MHWDSVLRMLLLQMYHNESVLKPPEIVVIVQYMSVTDVDTDIWKAGPLQSNYKIQTLHIICIYFYNNVKMGMK